jgi:hypothetical protein
MQHAQIGRCEALESTLETEFFTVVASGEPALIVLIILAIAWMWFNRR